MASPQTPELEEIIYYRLVEMEQRLEKKQEAIEKSQEVLDKTLVKAEAILSTLQQLQK